MDDPDGNYMTIKKELEEEQFKLRDTREEFLKLFEAVYINPKKEELNNIEEIKNFAQKDLKSDDEKRINIEKLLIDILSD
jgi:hypothetical protein